MAVTSEVIFPQGPSFFVATNGSDSNPGTILAPFRTLAKGVSVLTPTATLWLRGGTYVEALNNSVPSGNSTLAPVTISAYQNEVAILQPSSASASALYIGNGASFINFTNLVFDGANVTVDCIKLTQDTNQNGCTNCVFTGCEIKNALFGQGVLIAMNDTAKPVSNHSFLNCKVHDNGGTTNTNLNHNLYFNSNGNVIDGCTIYNGSENGIQIYHSAAGYVQGWTSNNIIRNNLVFNNGASPNSDSAATGIVVCGGDGNQIYNNVVYGNKFGIYMAFGPHGTLVYFNTVYNNANRGISTQSAGGGANLQAQNTDMENNISYQNSANTNNMQDGGLNSTLITNLLGTDPKFVNAASNNFLLQAGSPAIGGGTALALVATDLLGVTRVSPPAIGAYEYPT